MAGIAIILDLLRKNPNFHTTQTHNTLHSFGVFSAAASLAAGTPFAYKALFGNFRTPIARCDAASGGSAAWSEDYIASLRSASGKIFQNDAIQYSSKEYNIELKPLLSAFELRAFGMTTLRALLTFYLPLVEPRSNDDDDDDFLPDSPNEQQRVDYVTPLKKSAKQIGRETTVVTTRRVLERMAVHYVSERMAWKLLKDVPKSALRKAGRRLPTYVYFFRVSRTTFRGHFLGVAASWVVQVAIETYRFVRDAVILKDEGGDGIETVERAKLLGKKVSSTTVKCGASLVFASIGAGVGAVVFRPSAGQWIGCAVGDLAGPIVVTYCAEKLLRSDI